MDLRDLIRRVEGDDPLDRIESAMAVKAELDELGDALIGHVVEEARTAGRSWSEIGAVMGVSKQAAQQRHTTERPRDRHGGRGTFTRFDTDARRAVLAAAEEAERLGHGFVGTEHLLLGIQTVTSSTGAKVLEALGVTREDVLAAIAASEERFEARYRRGSRPFTPRAKKAIELALRESLTLGENKVGTEHLLLALQREKRCVAFEALDAKGVTRDAILREIPNVGEAA